MQCRCISRQITLNRGSIPMPSGRISYGSWLWRILAWDGVLPLFMFSLPGVLDLVCPNNPDVIVAMSIVIPIGAFLCRFYSGRKHICANKCESHFQRFQIGCLCIGILILLFVEVLVIGLHDLRKGGLFATQEDRTILLVLFGLYLFAMLIAMYPGRAPALQGDETAFDA